MQLYEQIHGEPALDLDPAVSEAAQEGLWHLSGSWRGGHPAEEGRQLLAELIVAIGVPMDQHEGMQPMRVMAPFGAVSPQVTHWIWRDIQ